MWGKTQQLMTSHEPLLESVGVPLHTPTDELNVSVFKMF